MSDVSRDRFHSPPRPAEWDLVRPSGVPRECFADEVAIDFPTVDHFIERLREQFDHGGRDWGTWGDDARQTLTAEVVVSRREAFVGALVPLEVPVRRICASCGGRGESWTDPCVACLSAGDVPARLVVRVPLPPGLVDGARLRFRLSSPDAPQLCLDIQVSITGLLPGV